MPCSVSTICSDNGKRGLIMEYGNGLYVKRDETTIKSVEALYHYINTLPLTKHQRGKAIRLAETALTNAENNGYFVGFDAAGFSDLSKAVAQFLTKKLREAGISPEKQ